VAGDADFFTVKGKYLPFVRESLEKMQFLFGVPEKAVLRRAFADADIVQIQFPFYLGYGATKLALAMNKKVVGAFHVQPQNIIAAMGKESALMERLMFRAFKFALFNRAPVIQCPSLFAAKLLAKRGVHRPTLVVSNGIIADYVPRPFSRPEWFGDKLVLMNVGRHALEKRQTLLIEGVKRSKYADKIQLLLCGKGELSDELVAKGAQLPVQPLIRYVSHEEKLRFLNTADLYVHGSVVELESLSCLEAVGCGLPCLIGDSPHSAAPQFALDERFLFKHDNADDLSAKMDYWYENREELAARRVDMLKMADHYRFERCLDRMEALYAEAKAGVFDTEQVAGEDDVSSKVPA
jgi:1,2-diacylglycerol 3-alpha-glucosyltransferase